MTQNNMLQKMMRGKGITLTGREAAEKYGIHNLRARMTQDRKSVV